MTGYSVSIKEVSRELTRKQRIQLKDTTDAIKLDEATQIEPVIIKPDMWAVLGIHNEKSENPDYDNYMVIDTEGHKYVTGSKSFWSSYMDIWEEMKDDTEDWELKIYRSPSKNYKGKDFITCSII